MSEKEHVEEAVLEMEYEEEEVSVSALEGRKPFYSIDMDGNRIVAGHIIQRDYENDRRLRVPIIEGTGVVLGRASGKWNPVDHYSAFLPALENGFEVKTHHEYRKGVEAIAFMSHPDLEIPKSLAMDWDMSVHNGNERETFVGIRVFSPMRLGSAINYTLGIWRQVCVNGLMVRKLGMGHMNVSHVNFDIRAINDWIGGRVSHFLESQDNILQLPERSSKVLNWPIETLNRVNEDPEYLNTLPAFAYSPIQKVQRSLPTWGMPKMVEQLEMARDSLSLVSPLDILNCLTNVTTMSPRRNRDGGGIAWGIYYCMDPLFEATMQLADIGAFMEEVPAFPPVEN